MQAFHYVRPPLDGNPSPFKHDQRMMIFLLGHGGDPVREVHGLGVGFEFENALQAEDVILRHGLPLWDMEYQT
jgi:hypothetical protein